MFHFQNVVNDWPRAVQKLPQGSLIKAVDRADILKEAKATNPGVETDLRHWYDQGQQFDGTYEANKQRAREFFASFIDGTFFSQYADHVDYVEEFNEYLANSQTEVEVSARLTWAEAAADVWYNEYRLIHPQLSETRLVLCNTAIGNWIDWRFAKIAAQYDCLIGYHPYTYYNNGIRGANDWADLSGLWESMDNDYTSRGYAVDWLFTEAGPFESAIDGWRSSKCLAHNTDAYVNAMREWILDAQNTHAWSEGRVHGFALFTTGRTNDVWEDFWTEQPEMDTMADMIAEEWGNEGTNPPPVEPPPDDDRAVGTDVSYWQGDTNFETMAAQGAAYTFIRGTLGANSFDDNLVQNWDRAEEAGLLKAFYHVYLNDISPEDQAEIIRHFHSDEEGYGFVGELPVAIDMELDDNSGWPIPDDHIEQVHTLLQLVEEHIGYPPLIYTSEGWWNSYIGDVDWATDYPLWLAQYNDYDEPSLPRGFDEWEFWQWTSKANGSDWGASSTYIDLNRFDGTEGELMEKYDPMSPIGDNLFRNPSFEGGHYNLDDIPELQIPNEWGFWYANENIPNPHDSSPEAVFKMPEVRVLHKAYLPEHEWDLFILDGEHTLKPFGFHRSWYGIFSQEIALSPGTYAAEVPVFADLVKWYNGTEKVWADDPDGLDGLALIRVGGVDITPWLKLDPGEWNLIEFEFELDGDESELVSTVISIELMCPYPLQNTGFFIDDLWLAQADIVLPPPVDYVVVVNLLPQDATKEEKSLVLDSVHESKETILQSADDAARLVAPAKPGSKVVVWGPERWDDDIEDWLHNHGVDNVELRSFS